MKPSTFILAGMLTMAATGAWSATLITDAEAALPGAPPGLHLRGITRGPSVSMAGPSKVSPPFTLKVRFTAHGGAAIDPASLKVVYLKSPLVDITDRVTPYASAAGIDMAEAETPAGRHLLRIEIKDTNGRPGTATLELDAVK